jgi:hypothetical protein
LISLNGDFPEFSDLGGNFGGGWVRGFPFGFEALKFLAVYPIAVEGLVVFFEFGDSLVLDDHFLVVASALGSSPFGEVL